MQISNIRFIDDDGTILKADKVDIPDGKWAILCPDMPVNNDTTSWLDTFFRNEAFYFVGSFESYWNGIEPGMLGIGTKPGMPDSEIQAYCTKCNIPPESRMCNGSGNYLFVSNRPFGIVWGDETDRDRDRLEVATQVQGGKLSGVSLIHLPDFGNPLIMPGMRETDHFSGARIQLGQLASMVGGNTMPAGVLRHYRNFLDDNDLFLIECRLNSPDDLCTVWVPAYWATAVIYLSFFGDRPKDAGMREYIWCIRKR